MLDWISGSVRWRQWPHQDKGLRFRGGVSNIIVQNIKVAELAKP
jgi:hypothetical protein